MEKVTQSLGQLAEAFLLTKQVSGCTAGTLLTYRWWLHRLVHFVGDSIASVDPVSVQRFFSTQQARGLSSSSLHQAYRTVKTFLRWGAAIGTLPPNLMAGEAAEIFPRQTNTRLMLSPEQRAMLELFR